MFRVHPKPRSITNKEQSKQRHLRPFTGTVGYHFGDALFLNPPRVPGDRTSASLNRTIAAETFEIAIKSSRSFSFQDLGITRLPRLDAERLSLHVTSDRHPARRMQMCTISSIRSRQIWSWWCWWWGQWKQQLLLLLLLLLLPLLLATTTTTTCLPNRT